MALVLTVDPAALMALARPGQPLHLHFVRVLTMVDARAKLYLTNDMARVRTGNLRSSFTPPVVREVAGQITGTLENIASYAEAVHEGSRPHEIRGRRSPRKLLKFPGPSGAPVFTHVVHHPGTHARPFLRKALDDVIHL